MKTTPSTENRLLDVLCMCPPGVSNAELAAMIQRSPRTVITNLGRLARAGAIEIRHRRPATAGDTARLITVTRDRIKEQTS